MTYLDPDRDGRPEPGFDAPPRPSYPQRRAPRHARHSADEPAAPTDLWSPAADGGLWGDGAWDAVPPGAGGDEASAGADDRSDGGRGATGEPGGGAPGRSGDDPGGAGRGGDDPGGAVRGDTVRGGDDPGGTGPGRAGRNLPAAIGVGAGLGAVIVASLVWRPAFVAVVTLAVAIGTWEMVRAVRVSDTRAPLAPLLAGGPVMVGLAWFGGPAVLPLGLLATVVAVLVWRLAEGVPGYRRDVAAAILIATYVPFLASFAVLLVRPEADGQLRVLVTLAGVVLSDTGGYVVGVLVGRHPMAPRVSPKKSWEGLVGSMTCSAAGGAVLVHLLLHTAWWHGVVFGTAVSAAAVFGDLTESLIKRDLGVKDMSSLLPGHGGLMDRLDSVLLAVPTAYAVLAVLVPAAS